MKKSLIALAVIAASGAASAQSSVTLYGLIDAYVGSVKTTAGGQSLTQTGVNVPAASGTGAINTSRFGLKGSEDLGGGLKANFQLEGGIDPSTGATSTAGQIFSRTSWVGLSGGFGEVRLGKMWTAYDDVKGSGAGGFDGNIFSPAAYVFSSYLYNGNPGNSIYYTTPSFGGFTATGTYAFGENKTTTTGAGHVASANVAYAGGPLAVALSYQVEKANGAVADSTKYTQLNASYDFGVAKLLGMVGHVKNGINPTGLAVSKSQEYELGVDVPLGSAFTLSGGFAWSKDDQYFGGQDIKRKGFSVVGLYALSKRTNLYLGLNDSKQDDYAGVSEIKIRAIAAGVRHTF